MHSNSSSKCIDNLSTKIYKITFSRIDNIWTINKIISGEKQTFPYYYVVSINNKHNAVEFNVYKMNLKRDTNVHTIELFRNSRYLMDCIVDTKNYFIVNQKKIKNPFLDS